MYKYILFDLDGTITDPALGITNSAKYALEKHGINVKSNTELLNFIGPPLQDSFKDFYGFSKEEAMDAVNLYRKHYREHSIFECEVYPHIETLLKKLIEKGYILAIATSKPEPFAIEILKHFNLDKYFSFIAGATFDESRCKKGDVIKHCLDSLNITDISKVIMIGDRKHDAIGAKEHNIDCIGVLYGYGNLKEFEEVNTKYIVENVLDILNIL